MATIVKVMQLPDSGLEIRDRMWLKITIANAVIGETRRTEPAQFTRKKDPEAHIIVTGCLQRNCIIAHKPYLSSISILIHCSIRIKCIIFSCIVSFIKTVSLTCSPMRAGVPHLSSGADVVDWLFSRVEGFKDRRDARKYASSLLKHGYLRHTVNKITFSEQCYYTFGDLCQSTAASPKMCATQLSECTGSTRILSSLPLRHGFAESERGIQRRRL